MTRIYYREGGNLHYTTLPIVGYSIIDPPGAMVHFKDGDRQRNIPYRCLTPRSQEQHPLPPRVVEIIDEQRAIDQRRKAQRLKEQS